MIEVFELVGRQPGHSFSPYVWRTRLALAHKGLQARFIAWHFQAPGLPDGQTRVPVMVDGGQVIGDSTAIALHLEAAYPDRPSLFGGASGLAHARFIMAWTDTVLTPSLFPLVAHDLLACVRPEAEAYFRRTREARLGMTLEEAAASRGARLPAVRAGMAPLRAVLAGQDFLGGDAPSYADYTVFGSFQWVRLVSRFAILAGDDPLHGWLDRMLGLYDGYARQAAGV